MESGQNASGNSEEMNSVQPQSNDRNVSFESHRKLLGEKKKRDQQLSEALEKIKQFEQEKLESEGKKDDVIANLRSELQTKNEELTRTQKTYYKKSIEDQIKSVARSKNAKSPDMMIKLIEGSNLLEGIEHDGNYNLDPKDVEGVIDGLTKLYPDTDFFKKQNVNHNPAVPTKPSKKALEDMSVEEIKAALKSGNYKG